MKSKVHEPFYILKHSSTDDTRWQGWRHQATSHSGVQRRDNGEWNLGISSL